MIRPPERLCRALQYDFSDTRLLEEALTHRSVSGRNNERLEFLGDAVLSFTIAAALLRIHADAREGELSRRRASLVRKTTLAAIANDLELGQYLRLGTGELKSGGVRRASILADALEAILGAIYLDGGLAPAEAVIEQLFAPLLAEAPPDSALKDPKTRLQEWLQARGLHRPQYVIDRVEGEAHQQRFSVVCRVDQLDVTGRGEGTSRRRAEQDSAERVLAQIDND